MPFNTSSTRHKVHPWYLRYQPLHYRCWYFHDSIHVFRLNAIINRIANGHCNRHMHYNKWDLIYTFYNLCYWLLHWLYYKILMAFIPAKIYYICENVRDTQKDLRQTYVLLDRSIRNNLLLCLSVGLYCFLLVTTYSSEFLTHIDEICCTDLF